MGRTMIIRIIANKGTELPPISQMMIPPKTHHDAPQSTPLYGRPTAPRFQIHTVFRRKIALLNSTALRSWTIFSHSPHPTAQINMEYDYA